MEKLEDLIAFLRYYISEYTIIFQDNGAECFETDDITEVCVNALPVMIGLSPTTHR